MKPTEPSEHVVETKAGDARVTERLARVHVIATGGTISYSVPGRLDFVDYATTGMQTDASTLLERVPELEAIAEVSVEQLFQEDGVTRSVGPSEWITIAARCSELFDSDDELDGIVVTHGSVAAEETAYFLNLVIKDKRPVVVTAAQRPSGAMGSDAETNLYDAVRVAASRDARGKGVLIVLNNEIHAAREATKGSTYRLEAYLPNDLGYLGYADPDRICFYSAPTRRHTFNSEFNIPSWNRIPWIEVLYVHSASDERSVQRLVHEELDGIIIAAMGAGAMTPKMQMAMAQISHLEIPVVLSSRVGAGRVIRSAAMKRDGYITADNLNPQKARILLSLAIGHSYGREQLQRIFDEY